MTYLSAKCSQTYVRQQPAQRHSCHHPGVLHVSEDSIRDLAVVLATAIPVIVVAYYAAIPNTPDRAAGGDILVPAGVWPSILRWWPVSWLMRVFGNATVSGIEEGKPTELKVLPRFEIGTSKGFVFRSAIGFLAAVWPLVLVDQHPTAAQRTEAVALVLTVWNLQALIFYSSLVLALAWQSRNPAVGSTDPKDARLAWSLVTWAVGAFVVLLVLTAALSVELWLT